MIMIKLFVEPAFYVSTCCSDCLIYHLGESSYYTLYYNIDPLYVRMLKCCGELLGR